MQSVKINTKMFISAQKMVSFTFLAGLIILILLLPSVCSSSHEHGSMSNVHSSQKQKIHEVMYLHSIIFQCNSNMWTFKELYLESYCLFAFWFQISPELSFQIRLHGFVLWASVGFLMPVSIVIKRMSNKEESGRKLRIIFYAHAITQACQFSLIFL